MHSKSNHRRRLAAAGGCLSRCLPVPVGPVLPLWSLRDRQLCLFPAAGPPALLTLAMPCRPVTSGAVCRRTVRSPWPSCWRTGAAASSRAWSSACWTHSMPGWPGRRALPSMMASPCLSSCPRVSPAPLTASPGDCGSTVAASGCPDPLVLVASSSRSLGPQAAPQCLLSVGVSLQLSEKCDGLGWT